MQHLQVVGLHSAVYRLGICDRLCYKGAKERENLQGGELFGGHHWQRFLPALSACMASVSCLILTKGIGALLGYTSGRKVVIVIIETTSNDKREKKQHIQNFKNTDYKGVDYRTGFTWHECWY